MKIKVCGMKDPGEIQQLKQLGVDYAGLIFFEGSKRFVEYTDKTLSSFLFPIEIKKIGVFVNEDPELVKRICVEFDLYAVQLHGDENAKVCSELRQFTRVIKAFRIKEKEAVDELVKPFMQVSDYFLFDNGNGGFGGTGKKFNWNCLQSATIGKPFFLSGGIGPGDAELLKSFHHPFLEGVDLNSRFETQPARKNISMLESFICELRKTRDYEG
jgi:phosphoribosylanthranilate isomerase